MSNKNQPFGIDVSKYQGRINWDKLAKATPKVQFVAMRLGISFGYVDEQYYNNMRGLGGLRLNRIVYHVPYFHVDAKTQTDSIMRTLDKTDFDPAYDRIAVDAEQNNGMTKATVTQKTAQILDLLKKQINRYPMIYSRGNWVDIWLDINQLPEVDWWLANYLTANPNGFTNEHPGPPVLPKGVSTWLIHQTGERNDGRKYGMESTYLDSDRWNGTTEQMNAYFGRGEAPVEPKPVIPEIAFKVRVHVWATPYVNVRDKPDMSGKVVGKYYPGDEVDVLSVKGDWYQFSNGYSVSRFYERINKPVPSKPVLFQAQVNKIAPDRLRTRLTPNGTPRPVVDWLISEQLVDVYDVNNGWWLVGVDRWASAQYMRRLS